MNQQQVDIAKPLGIETYLANYAATLGTLIGLHFFFVDFARTGFLKNKGSVIGLGGRFEFDVNNGKAVRDEIGHPVQCKAALAIDLEKDVGN